MAPVLSTTTMASSWAKIVDSTPQLPTPQQRQDALAAFYRSQSRANILREALGIHATYLKGMSKIAAPLVDHTIIICVDTESSTHNTDLLTEVGLTIYKRSDGRAVSANPGAYGVRYMEQLKFLHFRVVEHAHLLSNREGSLGPLGNRFGHTKFTTFAELRMILHHLFNVPIQSDNPEVKGCMCPVVLVGHALKHDIENGTKQGLDYNFADNRTIVARIDTQQLARDVNVWIPPPDMRTNEIGLRVLIQDKAKFLHLDDHTACNDAARTMICGIWMVVPFSLKQNQTRTMQEVANRIEKLSQQDDKQSPNPYGTVECCTRCGGRDHFISNCTTTVKCAACDRFCSTENLAARDQMVASHIEQYCPHVARWKAWFRRYRDAWLKNRATGKPFSAEILAGVGSDGHPFSTWRKADRPFWPLRSLSEALEGMAMSKEPESSVRNLQEALGGFPVPSKGDWVLTSSRQMLTTTTTTATTTSPSPLIANGTVATPLSTASPATNGASSSSEEFPTLATALKGLTVASASTPAPAATPVWGATTATTSVSASASTPTARREVKMSDMRGRGRGDRARGRGGSGRGNHLGGAGSGSAWDAWND